MVEPPVDRSVARDEVERVDLVVDRELVNDRRAGLVHPDDLDFRAFTAELHDDLVERGDGRDVPEVRACHIDLHALQHLLKVEGRDERVRRREEDLPDDGVDALGAVVGCDRVDRDDLPDLPGEEDTAQQHTDEHAVGEVVRSDDDSDGREHHDARTSGMRPQVLERRPAERADRDHDHDGDQRRHRDPSDPIAEDHDQEEQEDARDEGRESTSTA